MSHTPEPWKAVTPCHGECCWHLQSATEDEYGHKEEISSPDLKIVLAFVRALEHNTVMDSRLARIELEEQIMKTYEIFRADINKAILTIEAADSATAFGAWASAAMISGFIPFNGGYDYIGDERFSVRPVKAKHFVAEVREK